MPFVYPPQTLPPATAPDPHWNWNWATLQGPDAQDFLHRVTTADAKSLEVGQGTRACFLTPQGKLRAYFHLWRLDTSDFGFEFDPGWGRKWRDSFLASLEQYTFAERMALNPSSGLQCRWVFATSPTGDPESIFQQCDEKKTRLLENGLRLCNQGRTDFGRPWMTVWGKAETLDPFASSIESGVKPVSPETMEVWRIDAFRPRIDRELTENTLPLEASLMDAIAPNKGCYPGQEVIEKIVSLGSPGKRLAMIGAKKAEERGKAPTPGMALLSVAEPPSKIGQITSSYNDNGRWRALAMIRKDYAREGLEVQTENTRGEIQNIAPYA